MSQPEPLYVFVEIPKGSRNKYELDPELGQIVLDRTLWTSVVYPADYGFLIDTIGRDGDPVDALVLVAEPTFPGCVIPVEPIGVFEMTDEKGEDDKVLCVPFKDPKWSHMHDISDIRDSLLDEIGHFFDVYKDLEHGADTVIGGWHDRAYADEVIAEGRRTFRDRNRLDQPRVERRRAVGDLLRGRERVEPALVHLVEQPAHLGVAPRSPERARRRTCDDGHGDHLVLDAAPPPRGQPVGLLQVRAVRLDGGPQLLDALAAHGLGLEDRRAPRPASAPALRIERISERIVRVAGWSALLITITSGISITPAFSAWIESPEPGWSTSTTVSATDATSTSLCPTPTVSSSSTSLPEASSTSSACSVASLTPPRCPRVLIERMKTPGSRKWSVRRIRSPSTAPCVNGLEGSTETTPDRQVAARAGARRATPSGSTCPPRAAR